MRIPSGKVDQVIYFVAVDITDLKTRETALASFTVYRSRNGGAATLYTTPTVTELSAANMPGVYSLLIDEDTTIAAGSDSEEYVVHITQAAMAPVTRSFELYRRDTTSGATITVANGAADADIERIQGTVVATPATAGVLDVNVKNINNVVAATPGAANGILISGSNAGTTTLGALTVTAATTLTGNVSMAAGLNITQSSANTTALVVTGNGTGNGATITSGSGATGDGVQMIAASTNGDGLQLTKTGTGSDLNATVTPLVLAKTTNITGFNDIAATAVVSAGAITTLSGAVVNVDLVDVLTTYTGNTVQTGDSFARIGAAGAGLTNIDLPNQTMDITGSLSGSVGSVTGAVGSVTTVSSGAISEASFATTAGTFAPLFIVDRGTAQSATGTTLVLRAAAAFADTELVGATIVIRSATTGAGQSRIITAYVSATDTATVDAWTTTPTGTILYDVFGTAKGSAGTNPVNVTQWNGTAPSNLIAGRVDANTQATSATLVFDQTGNVSGSVGSVTGLTAANLDATVSSRMATYAQPTGFLAATFPAGTVANTTNITAGTITTATNLTNAPTVGDLTATMKTSVKTQVTDGLAVDTYAEPGQGTPAATLSLAAKINYLFKNWRNRKTQTSTAFSLYSDDAVTVDQKSTVSDSGTTAERGEIVTGP